jgi:hypothetical protein
MKTIRIKENNDRRTLGALCFVDSATRAVIRRPLDVRAEGLSIIPNRSFLHVIVSAKVLERHVSAFESPPSDPDIGDLKFLVTVSDPIRNYLPRLVRIALPRTTDPNDADSLFTPISVPMYAASTRPSSPNWSVIRASVVDGDSPGANRPVGGALVRVVREEGGTLLAGGMTDARGEAMIVVPGIPVNSYVTENTLPDADPQDHDDWVATGSVVETETSVNLEVIADRTHPWPADPDDLTKNRLNWRCRIKKTKDDELSDWVNVKLKTGQTQGITLFVRIPPGV